MGFIPQCQHCLQDRGASLLPGTVVEAGDRLRAGLGSLWEQGECKWQQDGLGTAGAPLSAGCRMSWVCREPRGHRATGTSAVSRERWARHADSSTSAAFDWEEEVGNPKRRIITGRLFS